MHDKLTYPLAWRDVIIVAVKLDETILILHWEERIACCCFHVESSSLLQGCVVTEGQCTSSVEKNLHVEEIILKNIEAIFLRYITYCTSKRYIQEQNT